MDMVTRDEEDPLLAADELAPKDLHVMGKKAIYGRDSCTLVEYVNGEDSIPVSMEFDSDRWDKSILGMIH